MKDIKPANRLAFSIKILSILQIISYTGLLYVAYSTNHDSNPSDLDWMGAFFPAGLFLLFGVINIVLVSIYVIQLIRKKYKPDTITLLLAGFVLSLAVFAGPITDFVDKL